MELSKFILPEPPKPDPILGELRHLVADAGGHWCGLQVSLLLSEPSKLVFVNPRTNHHLFVPLTPTCFEIQELRVAITERIAEDTLDFENRRVSVTVASLQKLAKQLAEIQQEIEMILERKKS